MRRAGQLEHPPGCKFWAGVSRRSHRRRGFQSMSRSRSSLRLDARCSACAAPAPFVHTRFFPRLGLRGRSVRADSVVMACTAPEHASCGRFAPMEGLTVSSSGRACPSRSPPGCRRRAHPCAFAWPRPARSALRGRQAQIGPGFCVVGKCAGRAYSFACLRWAGRPAAGVAAAPKNSTNLPTTRACAASGDGGTRSVAGRAFRHLR